MAFLMTSMLAFAQNKEDIAHISLKISNFENLSNDEKEELQENILRMVYFFDLDTEQVRQRLDDIEILDDVDQDEIILEFASQLNITLEELDQVYDDLDDNEEDDAFDDMDDIDDNDDDDMEDDSDDIGNNMDYDDDDEEDDDNDDMDDVNDDDEEDDNDGDIDDDDDDDIDNDDNDDEDDEDDNNDDNDNDDDDDSND